MNVTEALVKSRICREVTMNKVFDGEGLRIFAYKDLLFAHIDEYPHLMWAINNIYDCDGEQLETTTFLNCLKWGNYSSLSYEKNEDNFDIHVTQWEETEEEEVTGMSADELKESYTQQEKEAEGRKKDLEVVEEVFGEEEEGGLDMEAAHRGFDEEAERIANAKVAEVVEETGLSRADIQDQVLSLIKKLIQFVGGLEEEIKTMATYRYAWEDFAMIVRIDSDGNTQERIVVPVSQEEEFNKIMDHPEVRVIPGKLGCLK